MARILEAFSRTEFAVPGVHLQPEGDVTLVTLPVFFEVVWPGPGFGPGEVDRVDLLGFDVRVRPSLRSVSYVFGDGSGSGPTTDLGGRWPDGGVRHSYLVPGVYSTRVDVVYGGDVSVNGGPWLPVPGSATVAGAPTALTVRTARNELVR